MAANPGVYGLRKFYRYMGAGPSSSTLATIGDDVGDTTTIYAQFLFTGTRTTAAGALMKAGTGSSKIVCDTANTKFLQFYLDSGATSGDNRGMYLRTYYTGTAGGGDCLRVYADVSVAATSVYGAHISVGFGESTSGGSVTGLAVGVRATLGLPSVAMAANGYYTALMSEIYSFGAASDAGAVEELSFLRFVNGGHATGRGTVDDDAFLFVLDTGFSSGAAHVWYDSAFTATNGTETLKVKTPGGTRYLVLYDAR